MRRLERFKFLQVFGDGNPHNWFEVIFLGVQFLKVKQDHFENLFKRALENNLIRRQFKNSTWNGDEYLITPRGDLCLREEQIARAGNYSYYKNYDRTVHGKWGVDHFAPLPKNMRQANQRDQLRRLQERLPNKLGDY